MNDDRGIRSPDDFLPQATPSAPESPDLPLDSPTTAVVLEPCWRCDKSAARLGSCPYCGADQQRGHLPESDPTSLVPRLIACFALLCAVSVATGLIVRSWSPAGFGNTRQIQIAELAATFLAEAIDTVIVLVALTLIRIEPRLPPSRQTRTIAWMASPLGLAVVLLLNFAYHAALRALSKAVAIEPFCFEFLDLAPYWVVGVCVQPAIVEELFFRYLALGMLRRWAGMHAAVWVSSTMFAFSHIGTPLSIPFLLILGLLLGYARIASGSMALPMLLHFAHNAVVCLL